MTMCDYSLHAYENRPARAGEALRLTKFKTGGGSIGMMDPSAPDVAVCVLPGTKAVLSGIPIGIQKEHGVSAIEPVTFETKDRHGTPHRDGVRFQNGASVILQELEGSMMTLATVATQGDERPAVSPAAVPQQTSQRVRQLVTARA
jgi:hypothetical protein